MNFQRKYLGGLDLISDLNSIVGPKGNGLELGVYKGDLSVKILNLWPESIMYLVDIWTEIGNEYNDVCNNDEQLQNMIDTAKNIKGHEHRAHMIRTNSQIASNLFDDEFFDFIYIDANHRYDAICRDISLWFPKLRKGGVFSGHDYININWYDSQENIKTQMTSQGEISIKWYNDKNDKDKHLYKIHNGVTYYNGLFGVNPAVDEFCEKNGYTLDVTTEIWGTWWIIK